MKPEVEIYDTTLRDGSQGEGISFSVADKLRIAEKLDAFGVHYIEGGWPGSNPKDLEFFARAKTKKFRHARLAAFGSTRHKNVRVEDDKQVRLLLDADTPVVTIFGKTWLFHVKHVLRTTPDENLAMIADTVRFLKDHGKFVIYDAEHAFDGYKSDPAYAFSTWQVAQEEGADIVVLCDTNGGSLHDEVRSITSAAWHKLTTRVGIHTHNDISLGVANALAALGAGASHVQGTINGYGERTGNCNLTSIIPTLVIKRKLRCVPPSSLCKLKELSQFVDEIANVRHDPRQPWVGSAAFAHKGGTHVNAIQKTANSYEHVDPARVGNHSRVLVSDLAGRSNILLKARELGFRLSDNAPELNDILACIKKREHEGYEYEAAEGSLALLIRRFLLREEPRFVVKTYHVSMRRDGNKSVVEASMKVCVDDQTAHTVAEGDGPINALDTALRKALVKFYPQLRAVKLTDYKVRILDSDTGTASKTRVLIGSSHGKDEWGTVGVSDNIVEASLEALEDGMMYALSLP